MSEYSRNYGRFIKGLVALCVRNETSLEDFHAEGVPITDERMKTLMIEIVDNLALELRAFFDPSMGEMDRDLAFMDIASYGDRYAYRWDEPKVPEWHKEYIEHLSDRYKDYSSDELREMVLDNYRRKKDSGLWDEYF